MINRTHRFHGFNALRHVYAHGRTVRGPLLAIRFIPNERRSSYRAAVVVSRKIHKSAVVRNRIRRRLYEIIRQHEQQISKPYDIVMTVFSEQLATIDSDELARLVTQQLRKAGILAPRSSDRSRAIVIPKENQPQ